MGCHNSRSNTCGSIGRAPRWRRTTGAAGLSFKAAQGDDAPRRARWQVDGRSGPPGGPRSPQGDRRMLRRLLVLAALVLPAAPLAAQAQPVTVFVVRHAEKGPGTPDPSLTDAGRERAAELARVVGDAHPTALFATEFKRTQETLAPLAAPTGLPVTVVLARDVDELVAKLRALPAGSRAVVASHSNLVDEIVQKLSGVRMGALSDADYDRLVVVTLLRDGKGEAVVLRYGAP